MTDIRWDLRGKDIEQESFRIIEEEVGEITLPPEQWRVVRRLIHAAGDFSLKDNVFFAHNPVEAGLKALEEGAPLYSDSNMIRSGVSINKLRHFYHSYDRDDIHCFIADTDVARLAKKKRAGQELCAHLKNRVPSSTGPLFLSAMPLWHWPVLPA